MALFRKLFYRKPPDGLLEICDRVFGLFLSQSSDSFVCFCLAHSTSLSSGIDCLKIWILYANLYEIRAF